MCSKERSGWSKCASHQTSKRPKFIHQCPLERSRGQSSLFTFNDQTGYFLCCWFGLTIFRKAWSNQLEYRLSDYRLFEGRLIIWHLLQSINIRSDTTCLLRFRSGRLSRQQKVHNRKRIILHGGPIAWKSRRQKSVLKSTNVSDYIAVRKTASDAVWIRHILPDLIPGWEQLPGGVFWDNQAAILLTAHQHQQQITKMVDIH